MGAGVTDLYQDFNQNWGWAYQVPGGSGANGNDYYLYGQGRWGFSPWEKPDVYMFESALTHVPEITAPFLIMHGTADPTVAFQNGLGFYNALRYNGKNAILLAYAERAARPARLGEPEGSDDPVFPVLRPLLEGCARAEVDDRRGAVPEEGRGEPDVTLGGPPLTARRRFFYGRSVERESFGGWRRATISRSARQRLPAPGRH